MSDDKVGRELTPREPDRPDEPVSAVTPVPNAEDRAVERFSAGPRTHMVGLTEERSAQVVRQSGNARNLAFLAVLVIAIFIPVYWFYDIGMPAIGSEGRMAAETDVQYVTDVARGYALFLANCTRCHGDNGQGGVGPPLNDQAKLYNVLKADGQPGTGHLNPKYLSAVLQVGGRYVCGDSNSLMKAWLQPAGPLNYLQVEELIAWITASSEVTFEYDPAAHGEAGDEASPPVTVHGWRDPNYQPAPGAPTPPACWSNPSGQIGGAVSAPASGEPATIAVPGTAQAPRAIKLGLTADVKIVDAEGTQVSRIPVQAGEVVTFEVDNTAGFPHNFYIGPEQELMEPNAGGLPGIPTWESGVMTYTWTVPQSADPALQFACTVPGHYKFMNGDFAIVAP